MNDIFKVGIYIRLSKEDEDKILESESITNQRDLILNYISQNDGLLFVSEYVDDGVSGTTFDRVGFKEMIKDIELGKINTVVTKDLSRFGREYSETGYYLDKYFPLKKVRFISILDNIDTLYDNGNLDIVPFKAVFNDMYAKDISNKVRGALTAMKKQGKFTGWAPPFGYKRDINDKYKLVINEIEAPLVRRMFTLAEGGCSVKKIADIFSSEKILIPSVQRNLVSRFKRIKDKFLWCPRTILSILENPTYMGDITQGKRKKVNYKVNVEKRVEKEKWIRIFNTHEGIVDDVTFDKVQLLLSKNKSSRSRNNFLLSGFLYCKDCGHSLVISKSKNRSQAYTGCSYYRKYSKYNFCTPHTVNYYKLEENILNNIRLLFNNLDISSLELFLKNNNQSSLTGKRILSEIAFLDKKIEKSLENKEKSYFDRLNNVIDLDTYTVVVKKIDNLIAGYIKEKESLEYKYSCLKDSLDNYTEKIKDFLKLENPGRFLIASLIDRIEVSNDKEVVVYYKINNKLS